MGDDMKVIGIDELLDAHERAFGENIVADMTGAKPWREDTSNRRPTDDEVTRRRADVKRLIKLNYLPSEIARKLKCSGSTVHADLKALDIVPPKKGGWSSERKAQSAAMQAEVLAMHAAGAGIHDIAERFGVSVGAIRNRLHKAGVIPRGPRRETDANRNITSVRSVAEGALKNMSDLANLLTEQDLDQVTLTEDQIKAWEHACRRVGKATAHVRRRLKKGTTP